MMAHYESMVLVKSSLSDEEINGVLEKIRALIVRLGGQVTEAVNWGKKKLAYEIQKDKKAAFLIFRFNAAGTVPKELDRACRFDELILRSMTVAIGEDEGLPALVGQSALSTPESRD
jgi:small subunit ribosomal protein S6